MHPQSNDAATAWKKSCFNIIDNLWLVVNRIPARTLSFLSVDEMLQPKYVNRSTSFSGWPFKVEIALFFFKIRGCCFYLRPCRHNASWYLPLAMQSGFCLDWWITMNHPWILDIKIMPIDDCSLDTKKFFLDCLQSWQSDTKEREEEFVRIYEWISLTATKRHPPPVLTNGRLSNFQIR